MRVLLLGANGFLGRFVADRLLADPAVHLTALGRGDDADVRFDLAGGSPGALTRFLGAVHPGVVINCAGATRGGARELTRHNTVAVATVCEALRRSGCGARLVQLGCASEYGPSQQGSSTAEDAIPRPGGPYGGASSPPPSWCSARAWTPSYSASSRPSAPALRQDPRSAASPRPCAAPCSPGTAS